MSLLTRSRSLTLLTILTAAVVLLSTGCKSKTEDTGSSSEQQPVGETSAETDPGESTAEAEAEAETDATARAEPPKIEVLEPDDPRAQGDLAAREAERKAALDKLPLDQPLSNAQLRTTTCSIFLNNYKSQINSTKKLLERKPDDPTAVYNHAARVYGWGQLMGDLDTMAEAHAMLTQALEKHPKNAQLLKTRARIAQTLHRFDDALADLDAVAALGGADAEEVAALRRDIETETETGEALEAQLASKLEAFKKGGFDDFVASAQAREARGEVSLAQHLYGKAERNFKDVSPIPLAWLNVQRGLMAMHSGDFEAANTFFQAGYERCPEYPMAAEHLAEIEGRLGRLDRAAELYETVIEQTNNPEFMAALAEIEQQRGNDEAAAALVARADKRFRELLERHPGAVSGHAADFFLGLGNDPALALQMLTTNHEARPNAHAKQALAEALLANGKTDEAAAMIDEALASPIEFAEKHWTAARIDLARGDEAAATEHATRARELNPRIEELEGELVESAEEAPTEPTEAPTESAEEAPTEPTEAPTEPTEEAPTEAPAEPTTP